MANDKYAGADVVSAIPKRQLSVDEYLELERLAPHKSEFYRGDMFAMAGASREHNTVKENLIGELYGRLKGLPCRTYSSDQRLHVDPTGLYTYPDILIVCGEPQYDAKDRDTITNPTAIIEVLSPSTEKYDRGAKFRQYQQLASLKEYILVSHDEPLCERFVRQDDGSWNLTSATGLTGSFTFQSLAVSIPMTDIFRDVEFSDPTRKN